MFRTVFPVKTFSVFFRVEYETFDILEDEEVSLCPWSHLQSLGSGGHASGPLLSLQVRQGLKTYSNWPTYPQLYVRGELVGGLDIVKVRSAGLAGPPERLSASARVGRCVLSGNPGAVLGALPFRPCSWACETGGTTWCDHPLRVVTVTAGSGCLHLSTEPVTSCSDSSPEPLQLPRDWQLKS